MIIVAIVCLLAGALVLATAVLGFTGRLPRNRWIGVRTPASMRSDEAFLLANRIAGPTMIAAGAFIILAGFAAIVFDFGLALATFIVCLVAALLTAGYGAAMANKSAAKVEVGSCGQACGGCSLKDSCETALLP